MNCPTFSELISSHLLTWSVCIVPRQLQTPLKRGYTYLWPLNTMWALLGTWAVSSLAKKWFSSLVCFKGVIVRRLQRHNYAGFPKKKQKREKVKAEIFSFLSPFIIWWPLVTPYCEVAIPTVQKLAAIHFSTQIYKQFAPNCLIN